MGEYNHDKNTNFVSGAARQAQSYRSPETSKDNQNQQGSVQIWT